MKLVPVPLELPYAYQWHRAITGVNPADELVWPITCCVTSDDSRRCGRRVIIIRSMCSSVLR